MDEPPHRRSLPWPWLVGAVALAAWFVMLWLMFGDVL